MALQQIAVFKNNELVANIPCPQMITGNIWNTTGIPYEVKHNIAAFVSELTLVNEYNHKGTKFHWQWKRD